MHVEDEHRDRDQHEQERDHDRETRDGSLSAAAPAELHVAHGEHGVGERRDEESDGDLARLVAQDPLHDAR